MVKGMKYGRVCGVTLGLVALSAAAWAQTAAPASLGYVRVLDGRQLSQGSFSLNTLGSYAYTEDMFADGSPDSQFGARFAVLAAPLDQLSLGLSFGTLANHHELRYPQVAQTVGDPALLVRGGTMIMPWLSLGAQLDLMFPTDGSGIGLAWQAASPRLTTALGYHAPFGLSAQLNLGAHWLRNELAFLDGLDPVLRYSAQAANTPAVDVGLGVDYRISLLSALSLAPYVETALSLPLVNVDTAAGMVGRAGLGVRLGLGPDDDLAITAGAELAYLRPDHMSVDVPAVPPWAVDFGLAYRFDPFAAKAEAGSGGGDGSPPEVVVKEVVKEVIKEVAPPTGRIEGSVIDKASGTPVVDAVVKIVGAETSPLTVNGADGSFVTFPLQANRPYKIKAVAPGYELGEINAMVGADARRTLQIALVRSGAKQFGELRGTIKDAEGSPLAASVVIAGIKGGRFKTDAKTGAFSAQVPVGDHTVAVGARGYRTQKKKIRIRPGDVVILNVDLAR